MYDQRRTNRIEYVVDKITESERKQFRELISNLEKKLRASEREVLELRRNNRKEEIEIPPDDVLVMRIHNLENAIAREKAAHEKDVEELQDRLDVACEINAQLRNRYEDDDRRSQEIADRHVDILATLMAAYPFTPTEDLAFEIGLPVQRIRYVAEAFNVLKSKEKRDEAREYLRKQQIELVDRRGGDQGKYNPRTRQIEKIDKKGNVLATYKSIVDAANRTGCSSTTVKKYCQSKKTTYMKDGITFRYKDNENQNS